MTKFSLVVMATISLVVLPSIVTFSSALQSSYKWIDPETDHRIPVQTMAICMSGAARTVVDSDVQEGFNSHVRNSKYARGFSSAVPDLFMYVRVGDTHSGMVADALNESLVQTAIKALSPTLWKIDQSSGPYQNPDPKQLGVDPTCFDRGFFSNDRYNIPRAMNFFEGWYGCHGMIEHQEGRDGKQYDLVLFTRPDLVWKRDIPMTWFSLESAYFGIDWWQILPRKISRFVARTLPDYFLTKDESCCGVGCPEGIHFCRAYHICNALNITCFVVGRTAFGTRIKRLDGSLYAPGGAPSTPWGDETPTRMETWHVPTGSVPNNGYNQQIQSDEHSSVYEDTNAQYIHAADEYCQACHGQ